MDSTVQLDKWICNVEIALYNDNSRLCLALVSAVEKPKEYLFIGEPIAKASVNIPDIAINDDEIIIKNHDENSGILESLQKAGYLGEVVNIVQSDFVSFPIVKKSTQLMAMEKAFRERLPQIKSKARI